MEDLAASVLKNLFSNLSLTPQKKYMSTVESIFKYAIVGKTVYPTGRDVEDLIQAIASCWCKFNPTPNIYAITDEIFVVRFHTPEQLNRVMEQGPWNIYGQVFIIKKHSLTVAPQHFAFDDFKIWFYFDNLPYRYRDENQISALLKPITRLSGIFPELSFPISSKGFKIQIIVKCDDPLPIGIDANDELGGTRFVKFIYQNLPAFFCPRCRRIGHKSFSCPQKSPELEDDRISDGIEVDEYGRIVEVTGKDNDQGTTSDNQDRSSSSQMLAMVDLKITGGDDVSPMFIPDQADFNPSTGFLPTNDPIHITSGNPILVTSAGDKISVDLSGGKGSKNFRSISRPTTLSPEIVSNLNHLIHFPSNPQIADDSMSSSLKFKQKGKRYTDESSSSFPPICFSKKSRLESISKMIEDKQNFQNETQQTLLNEETNPSNFLGLQFGNLPEVIANMRRDFVRTNNVLSSAFTTVNSDNVGEPHTVEITRIGELRPIPGIGGVNVTRFHPYPNIGDFGSYMDRHRSRSSNDDRF